jgi:aerobic carbon-monoxide dehydrogenase medium subunit
MPFSEILSPSSLQEALSLCAKYKEKAKVMAGGTDLVVQIKKNAVDPDILIGLEKVPELNFIGLDENQLNIGAMTTVSAIEQSPMVKSRFPILSSAASMLATPLIRKKATIGGNLCNGSPSADLVPALLVLGAGLKIRNAGGERVVRIDDFFKGPRQTVLNPGELLTRIVIPAPAPNATGVYLKTRRTEGADLALVGVAVMTTMAKGKIEEIKIGLGAVAPTPIRARETEELLRGRAPDEGILEEICLRATGEACCISDVRCTAGYRDKLIGILIKRAILQSAGMAVH